MSLDPSYLEYAARGRGMDQRLYPYSNMFSRPTIVWPGGKGVAVWCVVSLEWFPMVPSDKPFRAPGHMVTPYPDYRLGHGDVHPAPQLFDRAAAPDRAVRGGPEAYRRRRPCLDRKSR